MGIDHHQQSDGGHQGQHHGAERIHHVPHRQAEAAGAGPDEEMFHRSGTGQLIGENGIAEDCRCTDTADQQQCHRLAQPVDSAVETDQSETGDHSPQQGQNRDQPGEFGGRGHPLQAGMTGV